MIKAQVDSKEWKEVEQINDDTFSIDSKEYSWDIEPISDKIFHVIMNNRTFLIEVVSVDDERKEMMLKVNDKIKKITVKDKYDMLLDSMGMSTNSSKKIKELKAPMPGLVIEVVAEVSAEVDKGSTLLILEAMKMENSIKSPEELKVKEIHVKAGETVDKNQVLVTFE